MEGRGPLPTLNYLSPLEALARIPEGSHVFIPPACGEPISLTRALGAHWRELPRLHLVFGLQASDYAFLAGLGERRTAATWHVTPPIRQLVAEGAIDFVPLRYSQLPRALLPGGVLGVDVVLAQVSPPDAHGYCSLGGAVSLTREPVEAVPLVIAEVNPNAPRTLGDSLVHLDDLNLLVAGDAPLVPYPSAPVGEVERAIGAHVAALIPDGATIQIGIGSIPDAVAHALGGHRDLGIHSGLIGDSLLDLIERGVVTNARKPIDTGRSVAGELMGSARLFAWAHDNPALAMHSAGYTHSFETLRRLEPFVAINSALQVDLTGQVNAESLGHRQVSGVGGQFDFVEGALATRGGISIVALPATAAGGRVSRIVAQLDPGSAVTTPRYLADRVVTEYGVAHLRDRALRERAAALIAIAHPAFREDLSRAWHENRG